MRRTWQSGRAREPRVTWNASADELSIVADQTVSGETESPSRPFGSRRKARLKKVPLSLRASRIYPPGATIGERRCRRRNDVKIDRAWTPSTWLLGGDINQSAHVLIRRETADAAWHQRDRHASVRDGFDKSIKSKPRPFSKWDYDTHRESQSNMSSTFISAHYIFLIFLYITFHKFIICLSRLSAHHIFNIETSNAILSVHTKAFCSFIEFLYANTPILIFSTLYIIFYVYTFINIYIFFLNMVL